MTDSTALTRRGMLAAGGAAILGAVGGYAVATRQATEEVPATTRAAASVAQEPPADRAGRTIAFHGAHQAGIESRPALLQTFIGMDLLSSSRPDADAVLRLVTDDAARLTQGTPALGDTEPELAGHPDGLTITLGLGRSVFERTGLTDRIPRQLVSLPSFQTDAFEADWPQTDLLLQVASDNAVTLAHTARMLAKDLSTLTRVRWSQPGFRSSWPATPGSDATRNLMGQVDGTINPTSADFGDVVWIDEGPSWLAGGTVLVLRRIRMRLDEWDILDRATQETVMGRRVDTGAPLGGERESDPVPFDAVDANGLPVIAQDAHIRVAHAATTKEMILRRPYSYDNGMRGGTNDMGLLFAAYMRDPEVGFIPMQRRISASDAFNRWNTTVGSSVYLLPSGVTGDGYLAEGLFT